MLEQLEENVPTARALISVYDKTGVTEFAKALASRGYELLSSGGTASHLAKAGLSVTPVESITGNPEAFEGRMKTLSFQIESAILFDRDNPVHQKEAKALGLVPIDVVVCNFYPFAKALNEDLAEKDAIELIDIGGPAMVRAAAKNYKHVLVVVDPNDYQMLSQLLQFKRDISEETRRELAAKAFRLTAHYDSEIDTYFEQQLKRHVLWLRFEEGRKLRYGENPHQAGSVFWQERIDDLSLHHFKQSNGKKLSFNNFLDSDAAVSLLSRLGGEKPACVIVKHANPCGAAYGKDADEAFEKAWDGDSVAAFGGIVALNRPITPSLVQNFLDSKKFAEIFLAPGIESSALKKLTQEKKNLIVLLNPRLSSPSLAHEIDFKKIRGGVLVQDPDIFAVKKQNLEIVSKRSPNEEEWRDLLFAWNITRESKSNTIILAKNEQLIGSGSGQQDRVRACKLAVEKAGLKAKGAVAASDGFFPFADGPEVLIQAGVIALLHPGGSIRDSDTVKLANQHGIALVTTKGIRAFKH